jgi:hypothetical protein
MDSLHISFCIYLFQVVSLHFNFSFGLSELFAEIVASILQPEHGGSICLRNISNYPTSAEVKKMWIYTFTPPYAFMA